MGRLLCLKGWRLIAVLIIFLYGIGITGCGIGKAVPGGNQSRENTTIASENQAKKENRFSEGYIHSQVPVLYYHAVRIEDGNPLCMPPVQFEAQMRFLAEHHYQTVTLDELYEGLYGTGKLPEKPVVITFDDGYQDNYQNAWPILREFDYRAVIFMVTDYVNGRGFLNWQELKELVAADWEIQGHTKSHAYLDQINAEQLKEELAVSKNTLERELEKPVNHLAYPYGAYDQQVVQAVADNGYKLAFTTERGWANNNKNPLLLQRVYCYADMGLTEFERRLTNPDY